MALTKGKHIVEEIEGVRCTIIEKSILEPRMRFLKDLLELNKLEVKVGVEKKDDSPDTFNVGVTDIIFNPVIAVYDSSLKLKDGRVVTPAYWNQETTKILPFYWRKRNLSK